MKILGVLSFLLVYLLLTIGIFGVILVEVIWMRMGYLVLVVAMLDILYQREIRLTKQRGTKK